MASRYEELCAAHRWEVPERYNIAQDVCDKHPRDKPAMVWESFDGSLRELAWGELQDLANQAAHTLRALGVERGDRVAVVLPPTPETAAVFFGIWKLGAILLSMSVLYGDEAIEHRLGDSGPKVLVTDAANAPRFDGRVGAEPARARQRHARRRARPITSRPTPRPTTRRSSTTRPARPGRAKGIVHAHRYLLAHEEFVYCHEVQDGERFHGMGEWAWAAGIAPLLGPWRLGAVQCVYRREGGFDPAQAARLPQPARGDERLHDADGDALDDGDRRRRHALPAAVPPRLLGRRAAEPGGDPLVPRAVRRHGARLLRPHRVVPARRQLPVHGGARGLDGPADAGLGRPDPRRGRAARSRPASAARSACARARTRTIRSATGATRRRARRPSAASGSTPRTPRGRTRTATSGTRAAPTT